MKRIVRRDPPIRNDRIASSGEAASIDRRGPPEQQKGKDRTGCIIGAIDWTRPRSLDKHEPCARCAYPFFRSNAEAVTPHVYVYNIIRHSFFLRHSRSALSRRTGGGRESQRYAFSSALLCDPGPRYGSFRFLRPAALHLQVRLRPSRGSIRENSYRRDAATRDPNAERRSSAA